MTAFADLEDRVFGSTGQSAFRMRIIPRPETIARVTQVNRLPNKPPHGFAPFRNAVARGATFVITIYPRREDAQALDALRASIWVWANLGGLGNRSRRGFGSPSLLELFESSETESNGKATDLPACGHFEDKADLEAHLRKGLRNAQKPIARALAGSRLAAGIDVNPWPQQQPFFILSSLSQISVGDPFGALLVPGGALDAIHGGNGCGDNLGRGGTDPWASPIIVRLHEMRAISCKTQYLPIMTWCHQSVISSPLVELQPASPLGERLGSFFDKAHLGQTLKGNTLL